MAHLNHLKNKAIDLGNKAVDAVQDGGKYAANKAKEAKREHDLRKYKPLFEDELQRFVVDLPEMVQIMDWDERSKEPVCKNAIAFDDSINGLKTVSIFEKNASLLDATFYPSVQEGVYYRDPCNPKLFINLNDYFQYLKKARVHELNQIAQDLGAKHIKITLKAEKKVFAKKKIKGGAGLGKKAKAEASQSTAEKQFESIEVASELDFQGRVAQRPVLNYFKNEPDILALIDLRMDENNPIKSDTKRFKYINSSGIKKDDAVKIEAALKKLKVSGNASISNEVEEESRLYFEYHIVYDDNQE